MSTVKINQAAVSTYIDTSATKGAGWIAKDPDGTLVCQKTPKGAEGNYWKMAAAFYGKPQAELAASPTLQKQAKTWAKGEGGAFPATVKDIPTPTIASGAPKTGASKPAVGPTAPAAQAPLLKVSPKPVGPAKNPQVAELTSEVHGTYLSTRGDLLAKYEAAKGSGDTSTANRFAKQIKELDESALKMSQAKPPPADGHGLYAIPGCTALRESIYTSRRLLGDSHVKAGQAARHMPGVPLLDDQMRLIEPK